ncbi:MAG: TonB-dependent receptor plug domain-containing protein [Cytophagales bacterium]
MCQLRLILLILLLALFKPFISHAQNLELKINGDFSGKNLNAVLKEIQSKYDLQFAFDERRLSKVNVNKAINNTQLIDFLIQYLRPVGLSFYILDETIIIKPEEEIPEDQLPVLNKTYNLSGFVFDSLTGERLPYALIKFTPGDLVSTSNVNGFFSIKDIPVSKGRIEIFYLGYGKENIKIESLEKTENLRVSLSSDNAVLNEVLVEGNPNQLVNLGDDVSKISINPAQMENLPNLGEVDIFRSIQLLPGINGTFETASSINIRGSAPDHNLILFDGFNVYHLDHFFGIFSAFNNNSIKNIQVFKGGFEAKYGGRVGGVLDITGKSGSSEKPIFGLGLNFIGFNALAEVPIAKKTNFFFAARRSMTDFFPTRSYKELIENVLNNDLNAEPTNIYRSYEELDPIFNFYDLNTKLTHRFSENEKIAFSFYHGRDILKIDNTSDFPNLTFNTENRTRWGNIGAGLTYSKQWEKNFYSDFSLCYSNYFSRVTYGATKEFTDQNENLDELVIFEQKNDVDDVSLKIDNGWNYSGNNQLEFGMLITNNAISYSVFNDSIFTEELSERGNQTAGYVQNRFRFGSRTEIVPGLRVNYYDLTRHLFFEPRLNANYKLFNGFTLKGAYGRYNQVVSRVLRRNIFASNPDFWVLSDEENIPVLSSDHLIAGFNYNFNTHWTFDMEVYQKWDRGVLEYIPPEGIFANDAPEYSPYFRGTSESKGVEFILQRKGKYFNGWISYAYSFSENQFEELNNSEKYPSNQDQRHEIKFVNMFTYRKFEVSAVWIYGSGRPYTAPLGNLNINNPTNGDIEVLYVSDINSFRLPDYHRLDISLNYKQKIGKLDSEIGFSIFNLYDRKNVKFRRFRQIDQDIQVVENTIGNTNYIQSDLFLLGFTPNISLKIRF